MWEKQLNDSIIHKGVLSDEVVDNLFTNCNNNSACYLDATFGGGTHTKMILAKIKQNDKLIALDLDEESIKLGKKIELENKNFKIYKLNFAFINSLKDFDNLPLMGVLFDLGVNSSQLNIPSRGFSWRFDSDLDMRMDIKQSYSAKEFCNSASFTKIYEVLVKFGEIKPIFADLISKEIIKQRMKGKLNTTWNLTKCIQVALPKLMYKNFIKQVTLCFQAIRIEVNNELENLKLGLAAIYNKLSEGGRLLIISFQSLEDEIIKKFFKDKQMKLLNKLSPSHKEIKNNVRARSALLRVYEKII